jgi:hypothetical protein
VQFGFGGGQFTTRPHLYLSLSLAQSPSHTQSHSLTVSLSLSLSLSLAHSLPLTLTGGLGHAARSFDGGIEGSEPHHTREPFLLGSRISVTNFPQAPNAQIRSERKIKKKKRACKNSPDSGQISPESGGVLPESLLIRVLV